MGRFTERLGIVAVVAAGAVGASFARQGPLEATDRDHGVAEVLAGRGLVVDPEGVLWLGETTPSVLEAATSSVPLVVRARPSADEPHDIYLASARLTPEGALLGVGAAHNLTETSAVDELRPVGDRSRFAFPERPVYGEQRAPGTVRLVDLAGPDRGGRADWTRVERLQAAVTRLQNTGRLAGVERVSYRLEPPPETLSLAMRDGRLRIDADDRSAHVALSAPQDVPSWLGVEASPERRPGKLVNWSVDRVRAVVGSESMQYVKAIAFSALDVVESRKEDLTGETGAESIAEDLGQESLTPVEREIPVDPEIGFPPPPLEPWVTPALPGEGKWNDKGKHPFIHQLPGLPPTFITTFIRSDRRRKVTRVYIAMWDPRLVKLDMMAGVAEPKSATGATGPGRIPREPKVMKRVAAAMNAGFQALHGEYGMMSDGRVYLPPKPYAASVVVTRDGSTAFGTWPNDAAIPEDVLSYRQNMTVLVQDRKFNPYGRTWWGGTPADWEDKTHTTRTGICLTEEGFVAYFYGGKLSPRALARAMIQARCAYGLALDMNAGHSGLEFYTVAPTEQLLPLDRPIDRDWEREGEVPGMEGWSFRARRLISSMGLMHFPRYIKREGRDFFYLTLRHVLPGPPLALDGGEEVAWRVEGLPQHGFPYALAQAEVTLPSGEGARVLKVDPRQVTSEPERAVDEAPTVLAVRPEPYREGERAVWHTPAAFSLREAPPVAPAMRIASGPPLGGSEVRGAMGVQDEAGMLVYVEADAPVPGGELRAVLASLGCSRSIGLAESLPLALGGDTALSGEAVRLPGEGDPVRLLRKRGPGARRIFQDTPVVPLETWHPLQARRIRYFKEKDS